MILIWKLIFRFNYLRLYLVKIDKRNIDFNKLNIQFIQRDFVVLKLFENFRIQLLWIEIRGRKSAETSVDWLTENEKFSTRQYAPIQLIRIRQLNEIGLFICNRILD